MVVAADASLLRVFELRKSFPKVEERRQRRLAIIVFVVDGNITVPSRGICRFGSDAVRAEREIELPGFTFVL